ncbi:hypothetical protein [Novosphingobium album (ex Liu et al. 2023)]|uniref:DUF4398 domain-containing protein n=1 Tax=Novosphingobium album (ex Liu et al. 2023) TaxID=3031130 RepID=A0ABT5WSB0_9SPHN|nr:hypothetical protein [Novosphingobium album (ex Liu et al. 2023)]MDE8652941.1 hypothetical protein [Novosphingobium album (ex Liu et al. 2023)]
MARAPARLTLLVLPILVAACASTGDYPSLALRDAERVALTAQPVPGEGAPTPVPPPASADLQARLAGLLAGAGKGHAAFEARRGTAERAVSAARGAGVASETWISAQVAIADLEAARSTAVTALAELDQLYVAERDAGAGAPPSPSALAIAEARNRIDAMVSEENQAIDGLAARLRG